jgi:hypothetical protein
MVSETRYSEKGAHEATKSRRSVVGPSPRWEERVGLLDADLSNLNRATVDGKFGEEPITVVFRSGLPLEFHLKSLEVEFHILAIFWQRVNFDRFECTVTLHDGQFQRRVKTPN